MENQLCKAIFQTRCLMEHTTTMGAIWDTIRIKGFCVLEVRLRATKARRSMLTTPKTRWLERGTTLMGLLGTVSEEILTPSKKPTSKVAARPYSTTRVSKKKNRFMTTRSCCSSRMPIYSKNRGI